MENKHKPVRSCIVCAQKLEKKDLYRVAEINGEIVPDVTHKAGGRGAYICKNPDCHDKLLKKRRLDRAFKKSVDNSVYEQILEMIDQI